MTAATRVPAEVFPPGEYLRDELEARNWTQTEFAQIISRPTRLVNEIIAGKRAITPATAKEIAAALGTSPQFWLNLEAAYQLGKGEPVSPKIAKAARLRERFPIREMLKRGWIGPSDSPEVLESHVIQFFGMGSIEDEPVFARAAKKTDHASPDTMIQQTWLFRVKQIAEAMAVAPYSESALKEALEKLKVLLLEPENVRHVPRLLAEAGVRLVIVEPLPSLKVDGACFWLGETPTNPVIGMSLRFDRIDNFWFVLRHEIEHVLRGDGRETAIAEALDEPGAKVDEASLPKEEQVANEAAAEFCVPAEEIKDFVERVHPMYWESRVPGFAQRIGVHPGLVVGQLQRRTGQYSVLRRHLAKIRHLIVPSAIADGYGQTFYAMG